VSDILTILESRGFILHRMASTSGGEWAGPCPVCGGRDRFRVWPSRSRQGAFFCRQCGKHGDLIEYFRWAEGKTYAEACEAAGVEAKKDFTYTPKLRLSQQERFIPKLPTTPSEEWREHALKFVEQANKALLNNDSALERLRLHRGLNRETVGLHMIGMNKASFYRPREAWGLSKVLKADGRPKRLWIPRGLVIPCFFDGCLVRLRVRRPDADLEGPYSPKYYFVPGGNSSALKLGSKRRIYIVVESELDGFLLFQHVWDVAGVIALGSAQQKPDTGTVKHLEEAVLILVALDYDMAGNKGVKWWLRTFPNAKHWPPVTGKDPGDMNGKVDLRAWAMAGLPKELRMNAYNEISGRPPPQAQTV
jgi:DNA primase